MTEFNINITILIMYFILSIRGYRFVLSVIVCKFSFLSGLTYSSNWVYT